MGIKEIIKRDFSIEKFYLDKITNAIFKAMTVVGHGSEDSAQNIALSAYDLLLTKKNHLYKYLQL